VLLEAADLVERVGVEQANRLEGRPGPGACRPLEKERCAAPLPSRSACRQRNVPRRATAPAGRASPWRSVRACLPASGDGGPVAPWGSAEAESKSDSKARNRMAQPSSCPRGGRGLGERVPPPSIVAPLPRDGKGKDRAAAPGFPWSRTCPEAHRDGRPSPFVRVTMAWPLALCWR
jgi:hypothetical protein